MRWQPTTKRGFWLMRMPEPADALSRTIREPVDLQTVFGTVKRAFREAKLATPDLDARILTTETLGLTTAQLIANPRQLVDGPAATRLLARARERVSGRSIGRIIGKRAFWSLELALGPGSLEPRPETEAVVELALEFLPSEGETTVADIGVGSGAILLSILSERPSAYGVGLDIARDALCDARQNAERHHLDERTAFVAGDFAAPLAGAFDLVVSNPPYIATAVIEQLAPTVRDYDPRLALDGGPDGLDAYRRVFAEATRILKPGAPLVIEIDPAAYEAVVAEAERHHLSVSRNANDLSGALRAMALVGPHA